MFHDRNFDLNQAVKNPYDGVVVNEGQSLWPGDGVGRGRMGERKARKSNED